MAGTTPQGTQSLRSFEFPGDPGISAADVLALLARVAFVVVLYAFVFAALIALRRSVRATAAAAHASAPPASLTLTDAAPVDGPLGRVVPLDRPLLIGRRPDCDVILQDDAVSGHHARIAWDTDGWQVEDLESTNGTYLNARRVTRPVPLHSGDALRVGNATWRVELP